VHVVWYTAMSMDGRIADTKPSLDFLETIGPSDDTRGDFQAFLATIDAVVVGATTLRWLLRRGHGWPHDDLPTWLISHDPGLVSDVGSTRAPFRRMEGSVGAVFQEIAAGGHERVWLCGGGAVAGQALESDRIDEVVVTVAPTALGAGPALFDADNIRDRRFRLVECRSLGGDAARLRWLRDRRT